MAKCPMFIDYVRECMHEIGVLPPNTLVCCESDRHVDCPFYKTINKIGSFCVYVDKCPVYKKFSIGDFERFMKMANEFCLSENSVNCARCKLRKEGKTPPIDLLADGTSVTE